jgi:hypothetical protein
MDVAAIGAEIENRVPDDLSGTMIRNVAAAPRLVDLDAEVGKPFSRGDDVRAAPVALDAQRDDRRMLKEKEEINDASRAPLLDQRPLHGKGISVGNEAKTANFEGTNHVGLRAPGCGPVMRIPDSQTC